MYKYKYVNVPRTGSYFGARSDLGGIKIAEAACGKTMIKCQQRGLMLTSSLSTSMSASFWSTSRSNKRQGHEQVPAEGIGLGC